MGQNKENKTKTTYGMLLLKGRTFIALALLVIYFGFNAPNFMEWSSMVLLVKHASIYGLLAIGMTMVIITGGIDLSVGAVVGLSAMIAGGLMTEGVRLPFLKGVIYPNVPLILLIVCLMAAFIGLVSGLLIAKLKVPAFIATLGAMYICRGFAMLRSGGATFPNLFGSEELGNTGFDLIGSGNLWGIPYIIIIFIVVAMIASFIMKKTPMGLQIYAVGGNERAAVISGIKTTKVKVFVYMFSALCAALAGIIKASELRAAHPATGETWEMIAISSVVLGGTSMSGGMGTIGGTIIGVLVITVLNDGMIMMGVTSFWQMVIKGVVIIIAVIIDLLQKDLQNKAALAARLK
ncbi:MAG: ABC transporter permease [Christensenellales bacterium]|jgi:erythritol transport system permease protein